MEEGYAGGEFEGPIINNARETDEDSMIVNAGEIDATVAESGPCPSLGVTESAPPSLMGHSERIAASPPPPPPPSM